MPDTVTVKLSKKTTVELQDLNGRETREADALNGMNFSNLAGTRAISAIRKMNGVPYTMPTKKLEIDAIADRLTSYEYGKLVQAHGENFDDDVALEAEAKNA